MAGLVAILRTRAGRLLRPTNLPALIAAVIVLLFGIFADQQNKQPANERPRAEVFNQVNLIRTKLDIVAEGVETLEHGRMLRDLGCDILQGFAFAKPMSGDDLEHFMAARNRLAVS
jgi:EAL domain